MKIKKLPALFLSIFFILNCSIICFAEDGTTTSAMVYSSDKAFVTELKKNSKYKNFLNASNFSGKIMGENYIMPGLKITNAGVFAIDERIRYCNCMVPQGLCEIKDHILITAYCAEKVHKSVIYVLKKSTKKFVKTVPIDTRGHVGGIASDGNYIWVCNSVNSQACLSRLTLDRILEFDITKEQYLIFDRLNDGSTTHVPIYGCKNENNNDAASFVTYARGRIWVGAFNLDKATTMNIYKPVNGSLEYLYSTPIPKKVQGIAVYGSKVMYSTSYGRRVNSALLMYRYKMTKEKLSASYITKMIMPPMSEGMYVSGKKLYVVFESASTYYEENRRYPIDRVIALNLGRF